MTPGDVFTRATGVYAVVALVGQIAVVVPIVRAFARGFGGDVAVDAIGCGIASRRPVARCRGRSRMVVERETVIGRLTVAEMLDVSRAISRLVETERVEVKYGLVDPLMAAV
jgi:ABC-type branched-subunit amino acid transport system ATPase component